MYKRQLDDRLRGLTSGAEDYMVKPFEIVELLADVYKRQDSDWYAMTLNQLILVAKLLSSKYTRSKVRKALPEEYAYICLLYTSRCV